jgi:hypothetical protein
MAFGHLLCHPSFLNAIHLSSVRRFTLVLVELGAEVLLGIRYPGQQFDWDPEFPVARSADRNGGRRCEPLGDFQVACCHGAIIERETSRQVSCRRLHDRESSCAVLRVSPLSLPRFRSQEVLANGGGGGDGWTGYWFELARMPDIAADTIVVNRVGFDDHGFGAPGMRRDLADVAGGGLEGVKEKTGGFGMDLAGNDQTHDLHEGDLDRFGVLKDGQGEGLEGQLGFQGNALALPLVEEAESALAKGRGATQGAIGFDMGTTSNVNAALTHEQSSEGPRVNSLSLKDLEGKS